MELSNATVWSQLIRAENSFNRELIKHYWNSAHASGSRLLTCVTYQGTMTMAHTVPSKSIGEIIQEILKGVVSSDRRREPTMLGTRGTHSRS